MLCGSSPQHIEFRDSVWNSDAADEILKPRITAKRVYSGIHPDPRHSTRPLKECLLKQFESLLGFT
jgi:hypothetical protein